MPAFSEYRRLFPFFRNNPLCVYGADGWRFRKLVLPLLYGALALFGILPTVRFWDGRRVYFDEEDKSDPRIRTMVRRRAVRFEGWDFCSRRAILESRERIRQVFSPGSRTTETVRERVASFRNRSRVVVGVHIRWGDYRGTERYFDLGQYLESMEQLRVILSPKVVVFLIFSHENLPAGSLPSGCFICSSESALEDMYSLAECDFILGPPSTFSMWASFYGGKPLFIMKAGQRFGDKAAARMAIP